MAAEAEAAREAKAKVSVVDVKSWKNAALTCRQQHLPYQVIAAEGEQRASRALFEASEVLSQSPAAITLRYLQTLNTVAAEKNSTIIFPLPLDMMMNTMCNKTSY